MLLFLALFIGIGYSLVQKTAELYTVPLLFFGASTWSGMSMLGFDWIVLKCTRGLRSLGES